MRNYWKPAKKWRSALIALLAFVVSIAPITAQIAMAAPGHHASHDHGAANTHDHDHSAHPTVARHTHDKVAAGSSIELVSDAAALVDYDQDSASVSQHDHATGTDSTDSNCCGTYCHSACAIALLEGVLNAPVVSTFERPPSTRAASVDPDQLQRPPSSLLSV